MLNPALAAKKPDAMAASRPLKNVFVSARLAWAHSVCALSTQPPAMRIQSRTAQTFRVWGFAVRRCSPRAAGFRGW
jgi:hypothetical protein